MKYIKRVTSLLLCLSMFLSITVHAAPTQTEPEKSVWITLDGEPIESLTITQTDKKLLTAQTSAMDAEKYQWQILLDPHSSVWVNIFDRTEAECEVSYALVKNMLDSAQSTYIRCAVTDGAETVYSNEICISVMAVSETALQNVGLLNTEVIAGVSGTYALTRDADAEYVTITIKYLDAACIGKDQETAIYSPYTATIEKGTGFKQNVVSPTFLGFAPYLDSNGDNQIGEGDADASTVALEYSSLQENVEIKVYYKPIKVNFAVKYFFQNIHDDLYTEDAARYHTDKAETGSIIDNQYLQDNAGDTTGFTKMYHIPESVAADGSTVFECYYDRNYYLIQFDLNGGYGIDPIYARYGTPFIVNEPIRHGYTFKGWELTGIDSDGDGTQEPLPDGMSTEMVSSIPAYNCYYQAQWENVDTHYTVVYWLQNANDSTKNDYLYSRTVSEKSGEPVSGKNDLKDQYICGQQHATHTAECKIDTEYFIFVEADQNVTVEGDGSTVVNVYYKPKEYTLKFYYALENVTDKTYWVIGGTTYHFGGLDIEDKNVLEDEVALMSYYITNATGQLGQVEELPKLNSTGESRNYTISYDDKYKNQDITDKVGDKYRFHYISFTAGYGQDISDLWPCAVFDSATRTEENKGTSDTYRAPWPGKEAFVSAWNGEYSVEYSLGHINQTIKGNYEKLDAQLLFRNEPDEYDNVVAYTCFWENGADVVWNRPKLFVYNIWVPVLPGDVKNATDSLTVDGLPIKTLDGVLYKRIDSYDTCDDSFPEQQTQPSLEGYVANGYEGNSITVDTSLYTAGYAMDFYYTREVNSFVMNNHGQVLISLQPENDRGVDYGSKLETVIQDNNVALGDDFAPPYPNNLEENAYYFAGWYTTEECLPNTEIDLSTATMPATGLILYAKWAEQTHTANFFTTYDEMLAYEAGQSQTYYCQDLVEHGNVIGSVQTPKREGDGLLELTFAGWFYMENGEKKAFSPTNMPINRDINIFAEWSSHSPQPYRIQYVLQTDPDTKVADDTTGYAYGGSTRTFNAKAGDPYNQLYSAYNQGYFPTVNSHSITIQAETDKNDLQHNKYTFYYVQANNISYTVRYVNKETNVVMKEVQKTTSSAVVTERFLAFEDMVPDAFYKRLVLEVVWDENKQDYVGTDNNVITFYYTPNETNAYYAVHFMLEKLGATEAEKKKYYIDGTGGYEETGTHIEGVGKIGETVAVTPQNIPGFALLTDTGVPICTTGLVTNNGSAYEIEITRDGTELYFFYSRNSYTYEVHYYEYNTTKELADTKSTMAYYGASVTEVAPKINGYTCVSDQSQTITIREDEDGKNGLNVIVFYYAPVQYVAEYVAVPEDGGRLSNTIEVITGEENLSGSTPTAYPYYAFEGWYLDPECTQKADEYGVVDPTTNKFTPAKAKLSETERNIFYAKFVRQTGDLTISRLDAQADQVFVYEIKNTETGGRIVVTVVGNGTTVVKDLLYGDYTVTQINNWSWRYDDALNFVSHAGDTTVHFSKQEAVKLWLNGNSSLVKNIWKEKP